MALLVTDHDVIFLAAARSALFQEGGLAIWGKVLKGAARSSAFLALYCTLAWRGACFGFQATNRCSPAVIALSGWTGEQGATPLCTGPPFSVFWGSGIVRGKRVR